MKKQTAKLAILITAIIMISGFFGTGRYYGIKIAFGYGGGGYLAPAPTPYIPPTVLSLLGISTPEQIFTPSGNIIVSNTFRHGEKVTINAPRSVANNNISFRLQMSTVSVGRIIGGINGSFVLGNSVFNLTARDADNRMVTNFGDNITVTIAMPNLPNDVSGLGVYWFNAANQKWTLVPGAKFDPATDSVTFQTNHFTTFAIIKNMNNKVAPVIAKAQPAPVVKNIPKVTTKKTVTKTTKVVVKKKYEDGALLSLDNRELYMVMGGKLIKVSNNENLRGYVYGDIISVTANDIKSF